MGYQYRGTQLDAHLPLPDIEPKPVGENTGDRCGTRAGYRAHRQADETPCQPCRDANNVYTREWAQRRKLREIKKGWTDAKCGTYSGYAAHRYHAVPVCDACREACRVYKAGRRERSAA